MSPTGLTEDVTIHQVGNTNGTASTQSAPYSVTRARGESLRLMEHPPPPESPLQDGQAEHDHEQQHRQGRSVAEVVELERLLVQVVDEHRRRRAGAALGEHGDLGEDLQRAD